ncbi:MAG TPA: amino acid adenylation domain-containing protein [Ktedonobacteraceae bacterium]|nr:amino acid adenylation domain-containing protein [Ktedonobacteraceae bacterium]
MDRNRLMDKEKKELLALLLAEEGLLAPQEQELSARKREQDLPLSLAQQRLWLLDQLEPGNPAYNIPLALRLRGKLHRSALQQSFAEIVRRHEALRTLFVEKNGQPIQVVIPAASIELPVIELEHYPLSERADEVQRLAMEEAWHSFDLSRGPLIRTVLLHLDAEEHVLLLTMHHSISDGWSLNVFMHELSVLYAAFSKGKASPLPELALQYADYALWQREWLEGTVLEEQLAYWRQQLQGAPPVLELRADRPRPAMQSHRGARVSLALSEQLTDALKVLSRREGATLFMTLLTAFQILLSRYSGQQDLVVGTPVAGRTRSETEPLIGYFLNNLAIRTRLTDDLSFRQALQQVRQITLDAYAHQDVPFERILQELKLERVQSHTPLFQTFFNMQNFTEQDCVIPGLETEIIAPTGITSKFDITVYAEERHEDIMLDFVYNSDLFAQARMAEMLEQYHTLLWQIVSEPEQTVDNFSLVTPTAQPLLPDPTAPLNADWHGALHAQFSLLAQRFPQRTAIVDTQRTWSYAELERSSNQLAHYLLAHGLRKGEIVAIYGHRNAALVCAILGILKAGGAYCILDPAYPVARLIDYIRVAEPVAWLQIHEAGTAPDQLLACLATARKRCSLELCLQDMGTERDPLRGYAVDKPVIEITANDLAYISFTSGSTGKPKGVLGRHGPLTHFFAWQEQTYGLHAGDRYSMLSGLSHDPLQREIFTPLWFGATICIPTFEEIALPGELASWMKHHQVSIAHLTPAMIQLLTQTTPTRPEISQIPSLRYVFIMSDVVTRHNVANVGKVAPDAICVNSYGATETQRAVANFILPKETRVGQEAYAGQAVTKEIIPVGKGVQDVQLLILTRSLKLAGIGEAGEIYIRSPHLAAGYLHDEALTGQRFIINPFTLIVNDRMYKTGDLGCYLPDGCVEVLGRCDNQVKIRGFRIEPGEIEAVLRHHPAVKECLVMPYEGSPGDKRLVAYLSLHQEPGDLYQFLKQRLPDYMIPSAFVTLEQLPVTPNGKVDRQALPPPTQWKSDRLATSVAPRTPVEEILAAIWTQVLGTDSVGVQDNFFELGGHSLLATQVISRMRDVLSVEISLRSLFEAPTIAELASSVERISGTPQNQQRQTITAVARDQEIPLSFAQLRLWFLDRLQPGNPFYNLHATLLLQGQCHVQALARSLNEIVRRHEILRTTFVSHEGRPRQKIAAAGFTMLPIIDLRERIALEDKHSVMWQAIAEERHPFDLAQGPLFRSTLLRLGEEEHVLLLSLHHIIADGWSVNVFVEELRALYTAFSNGESSPLPELAMQYADYTVWQRGWLEGAVLEEQLAYWKRQLQGAPPQLELYTDRPRPPLQSHRGARLPVVLPRQLSENINALGRQEGATLFMTLMTAFQILLSCYSGQQDLVVGTPVAGRTLSETEALIGFFVNTLLIRADLSGNPTLRTLLRRVRETCLEAYVHQDLPFERLVEEIQPERNMSINPLFQVMFVLQNMEMENLTLPGLTLSVLATENTTARFDIVLSLREAPAGLAGHIEYNTDLFDRATIIRMRDHFQQIVEIMTTDLNLHMSSVSLLTADEKQLMLTEWNATTTDWPATSCMHTLFEGQAAKTPSAVAAVYQDQQITYEELNQRANQLAHYLQTLGVGPEVRVGIYIEPSLSMLIAVLGILKAGGVYVPIDVTSPRERVAFLLEDAQIAILLTQQRHSSNPALSGRTVIALDSIEALLQKQSAENITSRVCAANLAYILYTSGSTGQPKGVMIPHRGLVNYLYWCCQRYEVAKGSGAPVHSSLAFDLTVTSLFSPLLVGRTVVLLSSKHGVEALNTAFGTHKNFSLVKITPAHLAILGQQPALPEHATASRLFVIGGEQLLAERLAFWREHAPDAQFINEYGPTETVVGCCIYQVPPGQPGSGPVPIGRPIANTQLFVLDRYLQPVPIGVPGELYIGGAGQARGYLNQAALTAERFIPDPFGVEGTRLYKTGDLARYRADGILEFLGRNDHQVKLRGFRIELGEIENALVHYPPIKDVAVVLREDDVDDQRLVAYIVLQQGQNCTSKDISDYLKERLPEYMVPAHLIMLEELPLTMNGKVDQSRLPVPGIAPRKQEQAYIAPQTAIEQEIVAIWQDVLRTRQIGIYDNFFEAGGHSLLLIQVHHRLEQAVHLHIPLVELFRYSTIHALAMYINQLREEEAPAQMHEDRSNQLAAGKNRFKQRLLQKQPVTR